jgi:hypothetical protein
MSLQENRRDLHEEARQLMSEEGFPAEGKKVLKTMDDRINLLTRENRQLRTKNSELQTLNEALQKLLKNVEGQLNSWRNDYMKQGKEEY